MGIRVLVLNQIVLLPTIWARVYAVQGIYQGYDTRTPSKIDYVTIINGFQNYKNSELGILFGL